MLLLRAVEQFCMKSKSSSSSAAVKGVALVLDALYDGEVVEEDCILQWYQEGLAGSNKDSSIWNNCKSFIDWLQSAESESDEE